MYNLPPFGGIARFSILCRYQWVERSGITGGCAPLYRTHGRSAGWFCSAKASLHRA